MPVIADFGEVPPFIRIRAAEARHVDALRILFARYGVPVPENPWPGRVALPQSAGGGPRSSVTCVPSSAVPKGRRVAVQVVLEWAVPEWDSAGAAAAGADATERPGGLRRRLCERGLFGLT